MKWKLFFQIVLLMIFTALIIFIVKRNSDVGRYVVKNAKLNFTFISAPKVERKQNVELIKIDTVTGKVWSHYGTLYSEGEHQNEVDRWELIGEGTAIELIKKKTIFNKICSFFKKCEG